MTGIERLDIRLALPRAAAGSPDHLRQQLEGALGGAKIRDTEPDVGRHHADQRDLGKIVALGDHLRADEHIQLAPREAPKHAGDRAATTHRIAIDARDTRVGIVGPDLRLDALGADSRDTRGTRPRTRRNARARAPRDRSSDSARAPPTDAR